MDMGQTYITIQTVKTNLDRNKKRTGTSQIIYVNIYIINIIDYHMEVSSFSHLMDTYFY